MGLSSTELPFYNIYKAELVGTGESSMDRQMVEKVKTVVQSLVTMLDEVSQIVDFFKKWDEQKRVRKDIKRVLIENFDESHITPITERFMDCQRSDLSDGQV